MEDTDKEEYSAEWWFEQLSSADKTLKNDWKEKGQRAVDRYLDKRTSDTADLFRYNIFWANVGILKAALFAQPPRPMVARQNGDYNDDVSRVSANILERLLQNDFSKDRKEVQDVFHKVIEDRLVPGLGQVWMIYEPTIVDAMTEEVRDPMTGQVLVPATPYKRIADEKVISEYVNWRDFIWSPARTWSEVWWVARRVWMRNDKIAKRFGKKKLKLIEDEEKSQISNAELPKGFTKKKREIFEIWCVVTRKVYHICGKVMLEVKDDPLKLKDFFPCPQPMIATHSTSEFMPRPDYYMLKDQYDELDELTTRIYLLEKAMRVVGVYDQTNAELKRILSEARENDMIPVENWGNLSEKGGLKGAVDWFPIDVIAATLDKLRQQKADKIQEIYELSGISDIMRGASQPRETAAAQKLKAQYSSVRLQYQQLQVAQFVADVLKIKAEIISKLFQPENIIKQSGIEKTDDVQYAQPAVQLIKDSESSEYLIEVSEESLALPDYNAERDTRVEYLTTLGQFISQTQPLITEKPEAGPFLLKMIQWVTAGFRGSKEVESVLDQAFAEMQKPQQPKPDPNQQKLQAEQQLQTQKLQGEQALQQQKLKGDQMLGMQKLQLDKYLGEQELKMKAMVELLNLELQKQKQGQEMDLSSLQQGFEMIQQTLAQQQAEKESAQEDAMEGQEEQPDQMQMLLAGLVESQSKMMEGIGMLGKLIAAERETEIVVGPDGKKKGRSRIVK